VAFVYPLTRKRGKKDMEKATLSVQELAAQLGISLPKAYELVKQPGFPVLKIGTRILIPVDAFKAWLISNASHE
jgi:excisionase family DNA binding protein